MKKLFLACAIIVFPFMGKAQGKGTIELGVNLGFNISNVTSSTLQSSSNSGLNFGGSAEYYFSNSWGIKAKVSYDQKGWKDGFIQTTPSGPVYATDYRLNYLTIPVTANWHFGSKKNWHLNFGPYFGILMSAKESALGTDVKEYFNSSDFGGVIGVGYAIPVTDAMKVLIDYEGQSGLTNIFKESNGVVRNGRSCFSVGILFKLK